MTYVEGVLVRGYLALVLAAGCRALLEGGWITSNVPESERGRVLALIHDLERAAEAARTSANERTETPQTEAEPSFDQEVTTEELASMLQVTESRVRQLARAGTIGRKVGGRWRFTESDARLEAERRAS